MKMKTCGHHRLFDCKTHLRAVGLALALVGISNTVLSAPPSALPGPEVFISKISLADLDVSTPEGASAARARLARVAQRLCRKLGDTRKVSDWATYTDCYNETLANALRQVKLGVVASAPGSKSAPR